MWLLRSFYRGDPVLGDVGTKDFWRRPLVRVNAAVGGAKGQKTLIAVPALVDVDAIDLYRVGRLNEIKTTRRCPSLKRNVRYDRQIVIPLAGGNAQVACNDDHRHRLAAAEDVNCPIHLHHFATCRRQRAADFD